MMWDKLNSLGKDRKPFLFISDFEAKELMAIPLDELKNHDIEYSINEDYKYQEHPYELKKTPIEYSAYKKKFDYVQERIKNGDTYLLNLTAQTKIDTDLSLKEIFKLANAHYKLRYKDKFVCFSPEK
ncbi:MAG: chorismate-binding protein, partial [Thiovulaceae bacterium]|nr:chorismate-binding protein [Sulfurimonadaceae bacterium]